MRWWLYNLLFAVAYCLMLPRFFMRMKKRGGYRNRFQDRFGHYPPVVLTHLKASPRRLWLHAVSVGEVYVAGQFITALRAQEPQLKFVLSTTSSTGWREAQKILDPNDILIYNPLDFLPCVKRALNLIQPRALILTESEIWPNLIRQCHRRKIPVFLINARVSDRSAPGYRCLRYWFGPILRMFKLIQAQSSLDAARLRAAGATPATIHITGSFKFDVAQRVPAQEHAIREFLRQHHFDDAHTLLLGGSTWPGEDQALVELYQTLLPLFPNLRLVIVPRHFEKADAVADTITAAGFHCVRRSGKPTTPPSVSGAQPAIILGDTTGELMGFYANAHIAFVGKSLYAHGGQNMIEPCLCGIATIVGPHTENFRSVMSDLHEAQAVLQVADAGALGKAIERLLTNPREREALGARALTAVTQRQGVVAQCARQLLNSL